MKDHMVKLTRWQLFWRSPAICVPAALLFFVLSAQAQTDAVLPPIGGLGGGQYIARCPQDQMLTGFELRTADDVDAIKPICVTAYGPVEIGPYVPGGTSFGGDGGSPRELVCPLNAPIVTGMYVGAEGVTIVVNNIHLFCGVAATTQQPSNYPAVVFDGPRYKQWPGLQAEGTQRCPAGLVAVGVHGKSGVWVDSTGLICGPPVITPKDEPAKSLGRVKGPRVVIEPSTTVKDTSPYSVLGQAKTPVPAPAVPVDAPTLDDLAAKGEPLANADPLAAELRSREPDDAGRRGFDIGMAAAEGQTAPGPGKQRIHDSLNPNEQKGFDTAVTFSLERNRNAELATKGAAIAGQDPTVEEARILDGDVFYWLGFDIATGIFGDPALGALGNTAIGPGSMKIRDSLSAAGQKGFNASVALHLSRNYKP